LIEVIDLLFAEGNPGGIKHVLKVLGICGDTMRLPLVNISEATGDRAVQGLGGCGGCEALTDGER
jgi:4-hydroxy-tetrahydrodipicolinate synthase